MTAETHTRTEVRHEILRQWPDLGFAATADDVAATYIEDVSEFKHSRFGPNHFLDRHIYRRGLSDPDRVRLALTVATSSGRLSQDGGNYSNITDDEYELLALHPDVINAGIMRGQTKQVDRSIRAMGTFKDSDMEEEGVDLWGGGSALLSSAVSNCTVSKVATEENVFSGNQALHISCSGSSPYCRGQRLRGQGGKKTWYGFITRADVGTITPRVYDYTNSAYVTVQSRSYSGEDFAFVSMTFTLPATCEEYQLEFGGSSSNDRLVVDSIFGPYIDERRTFRLPSDMKEQYSVRFVRPSKFLSRLSEGVYDAYSRVWLGDFAWPSDFAVESFPRSANPHRITFSEGIGDEYLASPMWLVADRPVSDAEPLDSESAVTSQPFAQVVAYAMQEIAEVVRDANPDKPVWQQRYDETRIEAAVERLARPPSPRVSKNRHRVLRA